MNCIRNINSRGFTLLELMISMVILATAFLGILPFFFYSQAQLKDSALSNFAMSVIQEKMERISNLEFDLVHHQDDPFSDPATQYTYILPEVQTYPCTDYTPPNPCGWDPFTNFLIDVVKRNDYFFTRHIDVDHPDYADSFEPDDEPLPDNDTLRVTITVYWTVPGGNNVNQRFVRATTHLTDDIGIQFN